MFSVRSCVNYMWKENSSSKPQVAEQMHSQTYILTSEQFSSFFKKRILELPYGRSIARRNRDEHCINLIIVGCLYSCKAHMIWH